MTSRKRSRSPASFDEEVKQSFLKKQKVDQETVTYDPKQSKQIQNYFNSEYEFTMAHVLPDQHLLEIKRSTGKQLYFIGEKQDEDDGNVTYALSKNPTNPYNYSGYDIGFFNIDMSDKGRLYYLIDRSGYMTYNRQIVAGIASFSNAKINKDQKLFSISLEFFAVHPLYRSIKNVGCVLLQGAEDWLVSEAKQNDIKHVLITIPEAIFPDGNDSVVQFYRKQGYILSRIQMGTFSLYKEIDTDNYSKENCQDLAAQYEIKGREETEKQIQNLLSESRLRLTTSNKKGESKSFNFPDYPSNAIPYLKDIRSKTRLQRNIERIDDLLKKTTNQMQKELLLERRERLETLLQNIDELTPKYEQEYTEFEQTSRKNKELFDKEVKDFENDVITPSPLT
jgi:hypothetical protein